jgi:HPt (histidine-containing phosphotransfer) domain-containing protein
MMFYMMLEKFEDMSLMKSMQDLVRDVEEQDYYMMKEDAHSIKGAAGYICASRIHYACYFI